MSVKECTLFQFVIEHPTFNKCVPISWVLDPNYYVRYQLYADNSIGKVEIGYLEDEWHLKVSA